MKIKNINKINKIAILTASLLSSSLILNTQAFSADSSTEYDLNALEKALTKLKVQFIDGTKDLSSAKNIFFGLSDNFSNYIASTHNTRTSISLLKEKVELPNYSLLFGGAIETTQQVWDGSIMPYRDNPYPLTNSNKSNGNGAYVERATLDFLGNFGDWVSFYIRIFAAGQDAKSYGLKDAFFLLGNLSKSPFYASVGLNYLPFGNFDIDAAPVTNGLNSTYFYAGNTYEQINLGYSQNGLHGDVALFVNSNDEGTGNISSINDFAANVDYTGKINPSTSFFVGAGYLNDAHATKLDFASLRNSSNKIPLATVNGGITFNQFSLSTIYTQALKAADYCTKLNKTTSACPKNITNKKPSAWSVQGSYDHTIYDKDTTFGLIYSQTHDMKNLGGALGSFGTDSYDPDGLKNSWNFYITRPFFVDNFMVSLDIQRAKSYTGKYSNVYSLDQFLIF